VGGQAIAQVRIGLKEMALERVERLRIEEA
jgi:hypothetical protein